MTCYKNISFCLMNCGNLECERNKKHLDNRPKELEKMPILFIENGCHWKNFRKEKE